ncbi:hypothetical protein GPECTOR_107g144 [Gonium pectorale]|uniref:Protein kinase domain-containing protein n=1 Tax=Gonium pectorale TaxID=33097 RepID=A0A150G115_GONPE|nr:hypothetical protein GPECTOR_107g144 [Gonium pectorale]|eukprot:KXZ43000.1 hypothetical protein GPECTOR_107g144 [Gonium pectorale]
MEALEGAAGGDDGPVQLFSILGTGSYGTVYLGLWRGLSVAAKILVVHDTLLGPEGRLRQRAILEAAIGTTLDHPNVVATYAFDVKPLGVQPSESEQPSEEDDPLWRQLGTTQSLRRDWGLAAESSVGGKAGGADHAHASEASPSPDVYQLYILQEFCSGGSIKEALEPWGALSGGLRAGASSVAISLHLAFQAAPAPDGDTGGLDEAERSWRDRLARPGMPPPPPVVAKVADFGLSLRLTGSRTHASGLFQGTPVYMAPEVVANGRVGPASDVYSFGVLLLELVMGMPASIIRNAVRAVPGGLTAAELRGEINPMLAVLRSHLPPDRSPTWPAQLRQLAADCLAPAAGSRPTCTQVAETLVGVMESLAPPARPSAEAAPAAPAT